MISSLCSSMIFSENRFPLFRIMLYGPSVSLSRRPCPVRRFTVPDDGFAELFLQDNLAAIALGVERSNQNPSVRDHNDLRPLRCLRDQARQGCNKSGCRLVSGSLRIISAGGRGEIRAATSKR